MSAARPDPAPLTLSELLAPISSAVRGLSRTCRVVAEVDSVTARSPNCFVLLTERDPERGEIVARCTGIVWQANAAILERFEREAGAALGAGMRVLLQGRVAFHVVYGLSLSIEGIDAAYTLGEATRSLRRIREALTAEGVIGRNRAMPAPTDFCRVAVLSPADAAGLADFRRQADRIGAAGLCAFRYHTARFQGPGAEAEILGALREIWREHRLERFDAVAIIRGGGSATDLGWLNRHALARAICLMPVPVITGIGHATDRTLLDEVAHTSLDTPSRVSAYLADAITREALAAADDLRQIRTHSRRLLAQAEERTGRHMEMIGVCARSGLSRAARQLDRERDRLRDNASALIRRARQESDGHLRAVLHLGPRQTLQRGYAIVRGPDGRPITRAARLPSGAALSLEFADATRTVSTGADHDPA